MARFGESANDVFAHSNLSITEGYMGNFDTSTTDKALQQIFGKTTATPQPKTRKEELVALLEGMKEEELSSLLASLRKPQPSL